MPAITSGKILVTGANGFVAAWVVKELLDNGFAVRGTVRSEDKATYLRDRLETYGDKLEFALVDDITREGAFDTVTDGVDAIMHIASPVNIASEEPDDVIVPAVNGTTSLLKSALKHRSTIKRVVVMSSVGAIWTPPPPGHANFVRELDENDWNETSVPEVRQKGRNANGIDKYRASKTLSERAAWDLYNDEKSKGPLEWDMVVLSSPLIFGPMMHEARTPQTFGLSPAIWYMSVVKGIPQGTSLTKEGYQYVDVRDLARAHLLSLTVPEAGGERFIIAGEPWVWQQFVDAAQHYSDKIPPGEPSYKPEDVVYPVRYSAAKGKRVLGITYRTIEDTTKDSLEDLQSRSFL